MAERMEYSVVFEDTLGELSQTVGEMLGEGWVPQGGVAAGWKRGEAGSLEDPSPMYAQAMIRYVREVVPMPVGESEPQPVAEATE